MVILAALLIMPSGGAKAAASLSLYGVSQAVIVKIKLCLPAPFMDPSLDLNGEPPLKLPSCSTQNVVSI